MIVHFGRPQVVNFRDPIFRAVTHLYTSALVGYNACALEVLPKLTHVAVYARLNLSTNLASGIAVLILRTLQNAPQIHSFVLVLDCPDRQDHRLTLWSNVLKECLLYKKFMIYPFLRHPRLEWQAILAEEQTVWDRADGWRRAQLEDSFFQYQYHSEQMKLRRAEIESLPEKRNRELEWEVDLVERDDFHMVETDPSERSEGVLD